MFQRSAPSAARPHLNGLPAGVFAAGRFPYELELEFAEMRASAGASTAWPALITACLLVQAILVMERLGGLLAPVGFGLRGVCITLLMLALLLRPAGGAQLVSRVLLILAPSLVTEALLDRVAFATVGELYLAQTAVALLFLITGWSVTPARRWVALSAGTALVADAASLLLGPTAPLLGFPVVVASLWAPGFAVATVLLISVARHSEARRQFLALRHAVFATPDVARIESDNRHLDPVTGVASRLTFDMRFRAAWDAAAMRRSTVALLFFSIDSMSQWKRDMGFRFVETLQKQVAGVLKESLRRSDDIVARFDQQHFVVMLPGVGREGATQIAERLRGSIQQTSVFAGQRRYTATVTVGAASMRAKRAVPREQLVEGAIQALEQARAFGCNTVFVEGIGAIPRMS